MRHERRGAAGHGLASPALTARLRAQALAVVAVPALGATIAVGHAFRAGIDTVALALFAVGYALSVTGVSVGFHRLFTHRAFEAKPMVRVALAILGSTAVQGPLTFWVATHRRHHQHGDRPGDPHSPNAEAHSTRPFGRLRGLWHAQVGWLFAADVTDTTVFARELYKDPLLVRVSRGYAAWVALGLVVPALVGGVAHGSWEGAWSALLWGGMMRIFVLQHATWSINSVTHAFGRRGFSTPDKSTNVFALSLLTWGESWHNNHHAFPSSAKFGLAWWQLDPGAWVIYGLAATGLVRGVRAPSLGAMQFKKPRPHREASGSRL